MKKLIRLIIALMAMFSISTAFAGSDVSNNKKHAKTAAKNSHTHNITHSAISKHRREIVVVSHTRNAISKKAQTTKPTLDLCYGGHNNEPAQVNALKVSLDKLYYMPADFKLDSAHLNGTFDHVLFVALARYQNDHKITAHGYYAGPVTRDSIKDVFAGGSGIVDAVPVAQASQPKPQGWFGRLFENKTMLRQQTVVNLVVRKCHYYFGERHSDRDTESYLTAVGSHLEYPTDERAGTVAIDPEHCEFGSLVQVIENGKVLSFVADDRGSAVILKKASHGRTLVFDFCSKEQLGSDYGSIRVFHYAGVPIQQLTAEQKENLHKLKYWHNGQFVPPVSVVQNYQGMKVAQR